MRNEYPYSKADRTLLDIIEGGRPCWNGTYATWWRVGAVLIKQNDKGYYHCYMFPKESRKGKRVLLEYYINGKGDMVRGKDSFKLPTLEDFYEWCREREVPANLLENNEMFGPTESSVVRAKQYTDTKKRVQAEYTELKAHLEKTGMTLAVFRSLEAVLQKVFTEGMAKCSLKEVASWCENQGLKVEDEIYGGVYKISWE